MLKRYHGEPEPATFAILPAIDLVGGRVVRLREGDFERQTIYGDDPAAVAERFAQEGATWLHVVDLDGARAGAPRHTDAIPAIARRAGPGVRVEVAGGLRTPESVRAAVGAGAWRVVLGTAALRDPEFAARVIEEHGADRVAVAVDVRDGRAVGDAWRTDAQGQPVEDAIARLADRGVETFEVTAIARDGLLAGPDLDLLERAVRADRGRIIASGGISELADLALVRDLGCAGAIVGRALYEGRFSVTEAMAMVVS